VNLLGIYEQSCNKVKILTNEKLFLQTKVDTVLKAQKVEEEEKKVAANMHPPVPTPPPVPHVKHSSKHGEMQGIQGKREGEMQRQHMNFQQPQ